MSCERLEILFFQFQAMQKRRPSRAQGHLDSEWPGGGERAQVRVEPRHGWAGGAAGGGGGPRRVRVHGHQPRPGKGRRPPHRQEQDGDHRGAERPGSQGLHVTQGRLELTLFLHVTSCWFIRPFRIWIRIIEPDPKPCSTRIHSHIIMYLFFYSFAFVKVSSIGVWSASDTFSFLLSMFMHLCGSSLLKTKGSTVYCGVSRNDKI